VGGGSASLNGLSVTVNKIVVAPMRNLARCFSSQLWMLLPATKVPFAVPRSIKVALEPRSSITQCFRETSGSLSTISAPERPNIMRALVKRKTCLSPGLR
jgi:hypothetical protein